MAVLISVRAPTLFHAADQPAPSALMHSLPAATQGLTLTQSQCPPTSACLTLTLFAMVVVIRGTAQTEGGGVTHTYSSVQCWGH